MTTTPLSEPVRRTDHAGNPTASLDEVDIRSELLTRPQRPPDHEGQGRALAALATELTENPRNMLRKLVETALELCKADTAGISLLEGDVFRWEAVAGVFATYRNGTMPRGASPCGVCIDRDATQLMHLADRHFPALRAEPRFIEALLVPFHVHGKPIGTVWIVSHSDRKFDREDERVLRTLSQFAAAGWQLWKGYEASEEANRHKDEFLAMLGHELRNPLDGIASAVHVLDAVGAQPSHIVHAREVIGRQVRHIRRLVDDLLDITRLTTGKINLIRKPVDLADVVQRCVRTLEDAGQATQHEVRVQGEPAWVLGDSARLEQIAMNLLSNAIKYTPAGGSLTITVGGDGRTARLAVKDTGTGLAPDMLERVFLPFFQAERTLDRAGGGLGVGLTLVRRLVELHGGRIEASSAGPGHGSTFVVELPQISPKAAGQAVMKVARPAGGRTILLVEDNQDSREMLRYLLKLAGHTVHEATDGPSGLEAILRLRPDVALVDLGLPEFDGYELAKRVRAATEGGDVRLVALTGYGLPDDHRRSRDAGFDAHIVKPVDPEQLAAIIDRN